ncbi:MAG TPA: hypothetical protein VD834_08085, partial [Blastococcus sp.]|nr:hypothetical protein [Blastococcus sp.]
MNTPARIAAFALGLIAVFGAAVGVGAAVGPVGPAGVDAPASTGSGHGGEGHGAIGQGTIGQGAAAVGHDIPPGGLPVS